MIDLEKAKKKFLEYTSKFDEENSKVQGKISHTLRVMNISKQIAESLNLAEEEIELATLIGLLHDIGRFIQVEQYKSFNDLTTIDHGSLGVEILKENNYIQKYCENENQYQIIYKAIYNHNKFAIEEGLTEEETLYAKIIRDADKLDIMFESTWFFNKGEEEKLEKQEISEKIVDCIMQEKTICFKEIPTTNELEDLIAMLPFVFDMNFDISFKIVQKEEYINKTLDRFEYENLVTKEKVEKIREKVNSYVEERSK